ncbi:MAG: ABC transporter permease [Ruminococcaceae bacterium]|nr:ABC transporter permease [Oscillospiraceae bacterium]
MKTLKALIRRNTKLFFKDKGMFFTSLITPAILLVLYATFLGNVYRSSFTDNLPAFLEIPEKVINGLVGGQLISSILAVSCVTVAFCSNMLMVQDKANGSIRDLTVSPVKGSTLAISYYLSTLICTLTVCFTATAICLGYIAVTGWYMSAGEVILLICDVLLLVMFGTALSSLINFFLSTQGQISAVGTVISSTYGFICGAYMPISQFSEGLQKVISCLPGTYGTVLVRNHAMSGALRELEALGVPAEAMTALRDAVDCNLYFFETKVSMGAMYAVVAVTVAAVLGAYIMLNARAAKREAR